MWLNNRNPPALKKGNIAKINNALLAIGIRPDGLIQVIGIDNVSVDSGINASSIYKQEKDLLVCVFGAAGFAGRQFPIQIIWDDIFDFARTYYYVS